MVSGTVLSGRVERVGSSFTLRAPYTFIASGDRFGGQCVLHFRNEPDALAVLQRLKLAPPPVRYKPGNPDRSFLDA
jgi:hypothetical protein